MFTCSASPAGAWPNHLRALGNTLPLIKLMSVEIAIFNHFDILGTKEMLFPPSGGLDSIKAAPSVKNNTLLGGWFFSPSPLERVTAAKGCLQEESCTAGCLTSALFLLLCLQNACTWKSVSSPAVWRGCSCAGIPLLIPALCNGSGNTESAPAVIPGCPPTPVCWDWGAVWLPNCIRAAFVPVSQHLVCIIDRFPNLLGKSDGRLLSPQGVEHTKPSCDQGGRSLSFLVGWMSRDWYAKLLLSLFCNVCILLQTRAGWSSHTHQIQIPSTTFLHIDFLSPFVEMVLTANHLGSFSFSRPEHLFHKK